MSDKYKSILFSRQNIYEINGGHGNFLFYLVRLIGLGSTLICTLMLQFQLPYCTTMQPLLQMFPINDTLYTPDLGSADPGQYKDQQ
jgi:hypothetical protein